MKGSKLAILGVMSACLSASVSYAEVPKFYESVTLGGYIQGTYNTSLSSKGRDVSGARRKVDNRSFNDDTNTFNLNQVQLNLSKPVGDDNYGFGTKLIFGENARTLNNGSDIDVLEAYMTYALPFHKNLSFTGGKFLTPLGFEVYESPLNPNITHGLLFNYIIPIDHTGIKANYAIAEGFSTTLGLVNGWDTVANNVDQNEGKTFLFQILTNPLKLFNANFQGTYGPEEFTTNASKRLDLDLVLSSTFGKLGVGVEGNYFQDKYSTDQTGVDDYTHTARAFGTWLTLGLTDKYSQALRFEVLNDQGGANRLGNSPVDGQTQKEITWTHKVQLTSALATRFEYRHDWSNQGVFNLNETDRQGRVQNTITADMVVQF